MTSDMIKKADLEARVDELDRQLQYIYRYKPSLKYLERNVDVLQSIGLDDEQIADVIKRGSTTIISTITNPQDGKELAIFVEDVSIRKDDAGEFSVFIGKVPYKEFFATTLLTRERLETLSKVIPEVKDLYTENLHLKELLAGLGNKV